MATFSISFIYFFYFFCFFCFTPLLFEFTSILIFRKKFYSHYINHFSIIFFHAVFLSAYLLFLWILSFHQFNFLFFFNIKYWILLDTSKTIIFIYNYYSKCSIYIISIFIYFYFIYFFHFLIHEFCTFFFFVLISKAKWVAKLRSMKTDKNPLLLKTDLSSGHFSASDRYKFLKETAFEYSFILDQIVAKK